MPTPAIEQNVPMPRRAGRRPKVDFAVLRVGESFFEAVSPSAMQARIRRAAEKLPGREFTTRAAEKDGVEGTRVWRVS